MINQRSKICGINSNGFWNDAAVCQHYVADYVDALKLPVGYH